DNCQFINHGDEGIQFDGPFGNLTVTNTLIENSTGGDGIKIRGYDGFSYINNVTIKGGDDDGIQVESGKTILYLTNSHIFNNRETGVEMEVISTVIIENTTIFANNLNGITANDIDQVTLLNVNLSSNLNLGASMTDITNLSLEMVNVSHNKVGGIEIISTDETTILNSVVENNGGRGDSGHGLFIQATKLFNLNSSIFSHNIRNGILVLASNGTIFDNLIRNNQDNGISLLERSNTMILNNSITFNFKNGILIENSSLTSINFNQIFGNVEYGILAENRKDGKVIDANYNYWGSDAGPSEEIKPSELQDAVAGPVNVKYILTSMGFIQVYQKPSSEDNSLLLLALALSAFMGTLVSSAYFFVKNKQRKEIEPHLIMLISASGIPLAKYFFAKEDTEVFLLSGFLSAIEIYGKQVLDEAIGKPDQRSLLKEIKYEQFTILIRMINQSMILALITQKSNKFLHRLMDNFALVVEESISFGNNLVYDDIEIQKINSTVRKLVEKHLSTLIKP
ncbi:MAG: right-handed parallel beta-helix repeat-containing protein, partial [Candidatus Heimdallarchaeota archaeon]|nr:right-handed parallel beta-helix repeat-containing protein [Candidatus Heimdallarchaeota archaeon]